MNTQDVGKKLVEYSNADRSDLAVNELYGEDIVSIEPVAGDDGTNSVQGIVAVRAKHDWWNDNHAIHSAVAEGPYIGHEPNTFVVKFAIDLTPKGSERMQMQELGMYTVVAGKVVKEEFLSLA